jgi:glycerophosphoryl diester phosphodiesterase
VDRLIPYLTSPFTLLTFFFLLLALSVITVFEIFCLIPAFHASYHGHKISLTSMFAHGFSTLKKAGQKKNRLLFLFSLFLLPVTNITVLSGYVSSRSIPDFVLYYIRSNPVVFRILMILFACIFLLSLLYCPLFECFCLEDGDLPDALSHSRRLTRRRSFVILFQLFLWNAFFLILLIFLSLLMVGMTFLFLRVFPLYTLDRTSMLYLFFNIFTVLLHLYLLFSAPAVFAYLSALYYTRMEAAGETPPTLKIRTLSSFQWLGRRLLLALVLAAGLFHLLYFGMGDEWDFFWNQNIVRDPVITAHRGDSKNAPENTMPAFLSAIDAGSDCIELDVRLTKDNVVVVMHDATLRRLCGIKTAVADLTYDELSQIDIGSYFSSSYAGTRICTLEEALIACQGKCDLNIELKDVDNDTLLEQKVVSLIEQYDYAGHCVIASQKLAPLKRIKEQNEDIRTVYLLSVAYGNYDSLTYVDAFSIKSAFITSKLVNHIHDNGKEIYAWTVNDRNTMEKMYSLGVDCLITDRPALAREVYYEESVSPYIAAWMRRLFTSISLRKL